MIRKVLALAAAACLAGLLQATPSAAHEEMSLSGKISALHENAVEITTPQGHKFTVALNPGTRVGEGEKRLTQKDLKVGQAVVVDGYGDQADDLLALAIRIVPPGDRAG